MAAGLRQVLARQRDQFTLEYACHRPDQQRWFLARVTCFEDANALYLVVTHDDITARRQAEDALSESEERYRTLAEQILQGISISRNGRRLFANPALATIFGYEHPEDLIGQDVRENIATHDQARVAAYRQSRSRGDPAPTHYELQGVKRDGTLIWLENTLDLRQPLSNALPFLESRFRCWTVIGAYGLMGQWDVLLITEVECYGK